MIGLNAEASSSRRTLDSTRTRRSAGARALSNATTVRPPAPSPPVSTVGLPATTAPSIAPSQRKVRTVPPSAVFDPPTPPLESQPTLPTYDTTAQPEQHASTPTKRRRRVRYISSDESSCDSDDSSSSDDEAPWWTFTARGMSKLRAMRGSVDHGKVDGNDSAYESGREAPPQQQPLRNRVRRKRPERSRSRDNSGARRTPDRMDSADSNTTPKEDRRNSTTKLFHPRPFRLPAPLARRSTDLNSSPILQLQLGQSNDNPAPVGMTRSSSAPGARPASTPAGEGIDIQRTDTPEALAVTDNEMGAQDRASPKRPGSVRRFLQTARTRHGSVDGTDNFTDSETTMITSPRYRAKQRLFGFSGVPEEADIVDLSDAPDDGTPTAQQRLRRLNANNLRIRLPPPISQHFANGWPHAGSWQHAYRTGDVFEERDRGDKDPLSTSTGAPATVEQNGRPVSLAASQHRSSFPTGQNSTPPSGIIRPRELDGGNGTGTDTDTPRGTSVRISPMAKHMLVNRSSSEAPMERPVRMKRKQRRNRRYRPAQVPPTPGGLGFAPSIRSVNTNGSWKPPGVSAESSNPFDNINPFDRIDEEYMLTPQQSRPSEKGAPGGWGWLIRRPRQRTALDGLSKHERFRRMLFLDARITIYLRLFNLAIVVTLLALAVTIRHRLETMGYPGIIGPSTTLIIAYASFTMLHVLTAIYREYFGRPIGLWGLRSKMLWVCLDLLFVALWSSATTLAINDYIDTPLDCTPLAPWWTPGVDYYEDGNLAARALQLTVDKAVPISVRHSKAASDVCARQVACSSISIVALLLYGANMVLSLFRIFETVRRTAGGGRGQITSTV